MKYLERKQRILTWRSNDSLLLEQAAGLLQRECVPVDLAVKEAAFKGSLSDRVASLEQRLSQVFISMYQINACSKHSSNIGFGQVKS